MLDQIKKITRSTAIYSIGQIAPKIVGLVLLPFFTNEKYLSAADYGKLSMLEAASALFIAVFGFGFNYALERWYYDKAYQDKRKSVFFTLIAATIVLTLFFWSILSLFIDPISVLLTGTGEWSFIIYLLLLCSALESLFLLPSTLLRLQEKPVLFVTSNVAKFFLYLAITLVFLLFFNKGLESVYIARAISLVIVLGSLSFYIFRNISVRIEWAALREMLIFRLPLVLSTISYIIFGITDRFSIRFLSDSTFKDVGIYNLGYSVVSSVKVVILASVWLSLRPVIYKMMDDPGAKRFYSKIMKYMSFIVVFMLLAISAFGQEAIRILAQSEIYYKAFYIIPIVSVSLIFDTLKEISQSISLNIVKKTGIIAVTMVIATVINILLNVLLIPELGIYGAALSSVISQIFFFSVIYLFSQKYYRVPYEIKRILIMVVLFIILGGLALLTSGLGLLIRVPLKLLILASFPVILYYVNFFEEIEIIRLKSLIKKLRNPADLIKTISMED